MYPLEKYKYYQAGNKVIAVSSFAGRTVRGVAKCAPNDEFDLEKGKKLAALRCNEKVAQRRLARAHKKQEEAAAQFCRAEAYYDNMIYYEEDAYEALLEARKDVEDFEGSI